MGRRAGTAGGGALTVRASASRAAAILGGGLTSFVVALGLVRAIRPELLVDPDPLWAVPRFVLWLALLSGAASAGTLASALFLLWSRSRISPSEPHPLPFRRTTLLVLGFTALVGGALVRFAGLDRTPPSLWVDDVSLIEPTLALRGTWQDFSNSIRPAPYGPTSYGSVGVLYLEAYRAFLKLSGTTVFGVRLPSALAGAASVGTAMLLGRTLLPAGGGALAGLTLAGLRWSLILSRWGWVAIVLAPILDVAGFLLVSARRRRSLALGVLAGLVAGVGAHVYLSAWVGVAALILFALWPRPSEGGRRRTLLAATFALAFGVAAAPLFLLDEGRSSPYFARANDHNVTLEIWWTKSALPPFAAAADALAAPWFLTDPTPRHDLPGRSRLGWTAGTFLFVALAYALLRPEREFSTFLLAHAAAAIAACIVSGRAGLPNGFRFGYLTSTAAVGVAGGALVVLGMFPTETRHVVALLIAGSIAIASVGGIGDARRWSEARSTFDGFEGQDTLLGRAAARWDSFGAVDVEPSLGKSSLTIRGVRKYRLDPGNRHRKLGTRDRSRKFRIVAPGTPPAPGERLVERVQDAWGREWARVYGSRR